MYKMNKIANGSVDDYDKYKYFIDVLDSTNNDELNK